MLLECRSHLLGETVSWSDPTRLVSRLARVLVQCHVRFCADRAAGRTEPTATICCPPPASLEMKTRWVFLLETGRLCPSQWAHGSVFRKQHLELEREKAKETSEGRCPAVAAGSSMVGTSDHWSRAAATETDPTRPTDSRGWPANGKGNRISRVTAPTPTAHLACYLSFLHQPAPSSLSFRSPPPRPPPHSSGKGGTYSCMTKYK